MNKLEELFKAADSAAFARNGLLEALKTATTTEFLVIMPLINRATLLEQDIRLLERAVRS